VKQSREPQLVPFAKARCEQGERTKDTQSGILRKGKSEEGNIASCFRNKSIGKREGFATKIKKRPVDENEENTQMKDLLAQAARARTSKNGREIGIREGYGEGKAGGALCSRSQRKRGFIAGVSMVHLPCRSLKCLHFRWRQKLLGRSWVLERKR